MNHREGGWSKEVRSESQEQRNKANNCSSGKFTNLENLEKIIDCENRRTPIFYKT
jgi:hypothetical protein